MIFTSTNRVLQRLLVFVVLIAFALETDQSYQNPVNNRALPSSEEYRDGHEILPYHTIPNNPEPAVKTKRAVGDITNLHSKLANLPEPAFRSKRAANHLATIHSRLTTAARIFSGISMRLGIHDDSLSGDQLIAEMLYLDSINLDNVANFNKTKVDEFFGSFSGLSVTFTTQLEDLENKIKMMNLLRLKYEKISDPDDMTEINAYITNINAFPDVNTLFSTVIETPNEIQTASGFLNDINEGKKLDGNQLGTLRTSLDRFAILSTKVRDALQTLKTHEDLIDRKILESPIVQNANLIKQFAAGKSKLDGLPDSANTFNSILNPIASLSSDFDQVLPHTSFMQQLRKFQSAQISSSGLINGFRDVIKLLTDVDDPWIYIPIDSYDKDLMKSELKPLEQFDTSYQALEGQWRQVSSSDALPIIQTVGVTFDSSKKPHNVTAIGEICEKVLQTITRFYGFESFVDKVLMFRETLITLKNNLTRISKMNELIQLESLVKFKDKIDFSSQSLQQVQDAMPKKGSLTPLIQSLDKLKPILADIKSVIENIGLANLPGQINNEKTVLETFKADPNKKAFFQYCDYLKQMKPHLESLSASVTLIRTIRQIQSDQNFKSTLQAITQKISSSIQNFNTLRTIPAAIKTTQTPRMDEFIQLKPIEAPSKSFGEAVAVLDTVYSVLSNKTNILNLIEKGWSVNNIINNSAKQDEEKSRLREDWRQFGEVAMYFESLITKLEASMTSARRIRRAENSLQNYATQLESFKNLPDFQINLQPMMSVLESLNTVPEHTVMLTTMRSIAKWDLQFSSHATALSTAGSSVSSIMSTFGSIQKPAGASNTPSDPRSQPVVPGAPNRNAINSSPENLEEAGDQVKKEKEKENEDSGGLKLGLAIGFGLLFLVAIVVFVLLYFRKEGKEEENTSKKSMKPKKTKTVSPLPLPARDPFEPSPDD